MQINFQDAFVTIASYSHTKNVRDVAKGRSRLMREKKKQPGRSRVNEIVEKIIVGVCVCVCVVRKKRVH
jgi:hypothetical protein